MHTQNKMSNELCVIPTASEAWSMGRKWDYVNGWRCSIKFTFEAGSKAIFVFSTLFKSHKLFILLTAIFHKYFWLFGGDEVSYIFISDPE